MAHYIYKNRFVTRMPENNQTEDAFYGARQAMLEDIALHARECAGETGRERLSERVMEAMARAPRHKFVPDEFRQFAYADSPLPIGEGKTISQPFMVALATDLLEVEIDDKVLEVGAGLGYQAAVLSELSDHVYAVELISELAEEAERRLRQYDYDKIRIRIGDGSRGWKEEAPFDKILVSAGAKRIPNALIEQLKPGGRMVVPTGEEDAQMLQLVEKRENGEIEEQALLPVRYSLLMISH